MIEQIAVVIPAHDEQDLLGGCLAAIARAARFCPVPVAVLVVLDTCTDGTAGVAAAAGVPTLPVTARNVGVARDAGAAELLATAPIERTWLATSDADSRVPENWFTAQLRAAAAGWDAYAGTVDVENWQRHPEHVRSRFRALYSAGAPHVHGTNLGVRATAYRRAGGFPPMVSAEDRGLVAALIGAGARVLHTGDAPVVTSARETGRAPAGFASHLLMLR